MIFNVWPHVAIDVPVICWHLEICDILVIRHPKYGIKKRLPCGKQTKDDYPAESKQRMTSEKKVC